MDKKEERMHLLQRLFDDFTLLEIGKSIGDEYALRFNDLGYDEAYNYFDRLSLLERLASRLSDDQLVSIVDKYREELPPDVAFIGRYYTYMPDNRRLYIKSIWDHLRKKIWELCRDYGDLAYRVLDKLIKMKRDWSYYSDVEYPRLIRSLAEEHGISRDDADSIISVLRELYIVRLEGDLIKIFREAREFLDELYIELDRKCLSAKPNETE